MYRAKAFSVPNHGSLEHHNLVFFPLRDEIEPEAVQLYHTG